MIPPYVVLTRPQGRFSRGGFLGLRHKPFVTGGDPRPGARSPSRASSLDGVTDERQQVAARTAARARHARQGAPRATRRFERARRVRGEGLRPDPRRRRQGVRPERRRRTRCATATGAPRFGQSCLVARRLVETGVPYVTINYGGWDTHKQHFQAMRQQAAGARPRHVGAARGPRRSAACSTARSSGGAASSAARRGCSGRSRGTAAAATSGPCFSRGGRRRRLQGRPGRRRVRRDGRWRSPSGPSIRTTCIGSMYELLGIDPDGPLPNPRGVDVARAAAVREGRAPRTSEGDHVTRAGRRFRGLLAAAALALLLVGLAPRRRTAPPCRRVPASRTSATSTPAAVRSAPRSR